MPSINLGTHAISKVCIGTTNVNKIYKGTNLVYEYIVYPVWEDWSTYQLLKSLSASPIPVNNVTYSSTVASKLPFKVSSKASITSCILPNGKEWLCFAEPTKSLLYLTSNDDSNVSMSMYLPEPYTRCWVSIDADLYIHLVGLTKDGKVHYFQSTIGDTGLTAWAQIKELVVDSNKTIASIYSADTPANNCITLIVNYTDDTADVYHKIYGE